MAGPSCCCCKSYGVQTGNVGPGAGSGLRRITVPDGGYVASNKVKVDVFPYIASTYPRTVDYRNKKIFILNLSSISKSPPFILIDQYNLTSFQFERTVNRIDMPLVDADGGGFTVGQYGNICCDPFGYHLYVTYQTIREINSIDPVTHQGPGPSGENIYSEGVVEKFNYFGGGREIIGTDTWWELTPTLLSPMGRGISYDRHNDRIYYSLTIRKGFNVVPPPTPPQNTTWSYLRYFDASGGTPLTPTDLDIVGMNSLAFTGNATVGSNRDMSLPSICISHQRNKLSWLLRYSTVLTGLPAITVALANRIQISEMDGAGLYDLINRDEYRLTLLHWSEFKDSFFYERTEASDISDNILYAIGFNGSNERKIFNSRQLYDDTFKSSYLGAARVFFGCQQESIGDNFNGTGMGVFA